jgi:hypothetical protein
MTVATKPRIVIGATTLAGLAVLGGVGAVLHKDVGTPTGATVLKVTVVATTTAPPGADSALARLMSMLPAGYDANNCAAVDNPPRDSLATVDCDQNSLTNGPASARFSLYPDVPTLDAHFQTAANEDQVQQCPGGVASPGTWHYTSSPDSPAGKLVCGTYEGTPDLVWSQNDRLLLGNLQGADLQSIYTFWANNTA